jgi:hypothetical protein
MEETAHSAAFGVRDPEFMRQACEQMDRLNEELRQKFVVQEIGVEIIRDQIFG